MTRETVLAMEILTHSEVFNNFLCSRQHWETTTTWGSPLTGDGKSTGGHECPYHPRVSLSTREQPAPEGRDEQEIRTKINGCPILDFDKYE